MSQLLFDYVLPLLFTLPFRLRTLASALLRSAGLLALKKKRQLCWRALPMML